jgi:hypothetical protein
MTKRRNFSTGLKVAIKDRATRENGQTYCEKCGEPCKRGEVHHLEMDAMKIDKSRKLTAADGAFWCLPCHGEATKAQAPILAKAKARQAAHAGIKAPSRKMPSRPWPVTEKASRPVTKVMQRKAIYE